MLSDVLGHRVYSLLVLRDILFLEVYAELSGHGLVSLKNQSSMER
jgi:hypothetical protein